MFCLAESIQVSKHTVTFQFTRIAYFDMCRVSVHALHFLQYLICRIRQIDTVAQRLTHLSLSVRTRQTQTCRIIRKKDFRFYQCFAIDMVETAYNLTCLFNHRFLVFSHRNSSSLECCNIGSLADRIGKETCFEVTHLDFSLHRRITLQARYGYQIHKIEAQFIEFRNLRLNKDG